MTQIEITHLSHRYKDGTQALDDVNLSVAKGAFIVLAGANGSGKTTLLRHLNGLLKPTQGSVRIDDFDVSKNGRRARQRVGMVFQDADSQIVGETVADDTAFGPENLLWDHAKIDQSVDAALTAVGLQHAAERRPHTLSGGEKRRLAIAGILAMAPKIVVFDEPFTNLDYPGVVQVLKQMLDLHQSGHTLLVATHDLEIVIAHADRLVVMADGRIVADGDPIEVIDRVESYGIRVPCTVRLGKGLQPWLTL